MTKPAAFARGRRLRRTSALRDVLREHRVHVHDLVAPLFVTDADALAGPVPTLPGVRRHHLRDIVDAARAVADAGVRAILLFGVPGQKDEHGTGAWRDDGVVACAIRAIRDAGIDVVIAADVCLCQFTTHGHCGALANGHIDNDTTLMAIARIGVAYAAAGAQIVAPSGMMDGTVGEMRRALDLAGHQDVSILSYSVKHASALYGPFRDAARSTPAQGDRRSHQLDAANSREALREAAHDVDEGADMVMVKPALTNLDTLVRLRAQHPTTPLVAFEVSGEYAMLEAAAANGWLDARAVALETLTAIKRAGADLIITYRALAIARWLREETGT
jgi:porphobilinogen synthase